MHRFVLFLAALLAFAGSSFAQSNNAGSNLPKVLRGASAETSIKSKKAPVRAVAHKSSVGRRSVQRPTIKRPPQQHVRAARYGGFMMAPPPPPPVLDTTSPRTLSLVNVNSGEALTVTYWSDGAYHRDALDKLNYFLRDTRENQQTEMDPLLLDVLWHTSRIVGYGGTIEVLSAFRSPTTNAWLASVSRGVASDSQHMNGNAMDIRMPGVPVFKIRQAARSLGMGGVGFYPRSGFVHIDTGPVRYW